MEIRVILNQSIVLSQKKENEIPDELKEQGLDVCASDNYLFLCKCHEDDSKVKSDSFTANISHYSRTAYCAMPAEKYYETNGDFNEEKIVKQMIVSYCELQGENKNQMRFLLHGIKMQIVLLNSQTATWIMFLQIHL